MIKDIIVFAMMAYLLSSCSMNDNYDNVATQRGTALLVADVSVGSDKIGEVATRAALTVDIGISRILAGIYAAQNNLKYTYDAGAWTPPSSTNQIFVAMGDATLCAYTPYSLSYTGTVSMSSGLYAATNDFCYGYVAGVNANNLGSGVTFTLSHAYSKLALRITKDALYDGTGNITSITIAGATNVGTLTLTGTTASMGVTSASTVAVTGSPIKTLSSTVGATVDVDLLMVPTSLFADLTFTIVVDGNTKTATYASLPALVAGSSYIIPITVSKKDILDLPSAGNVISSTDWDSNFNLERPLE